MSMVEVGRSLEGESLGPYRLEQFVGGGGMGVVFRALDTTLNRIVAVKVLLRQQSADEEMLKRFQNEAQSAARLDHENIGRVHAVGSDNGWHYIVFEFIEGTNLRDVINESGPFDLPRTIDVTIQIAEALEHASQRDVVHRDIKPSNIIITPAGRARIVDMGLARLHQVADDQDLTVSGMTLGTFDYISPEQARDPRSADVRSDLYSLGCTLFFMLVGKPPFADGTMVQKLLQQQQDAPPAIELLRPDVPPKFAAILGRLMEKDPIHRYQKPVELIADLHAFAADAGIELTAPKPTVGFAEEPVKSSLGARLPWILPLLIFTAIVGVLWLRSNSTRINERQESLDQMPAGTSLEKPVTEVPAALKNVHRVVAVPIKKGEYSTLQEALGAALDGDEIELAFSTTRDESPFIVDKKHLLLRAAEGFRPTVRFEMPLVEGQDRERAACTITEGSLEIHGIGIQVETGSRAQARGQATLFTLQGAATLACEDVLVEMSSDGANSRETSLPSLTAGNSTGRVIVVSAVCPVEDLSIRQVIRMLRCTVRGDAVFLDAAKCGQVELVWTDGSIATPARFLIAEGSARSETVGRRLRVALTGGLFACGEGFACLLDSPAKPVAAVLRGFAVKCQFVIPQGQALLEQSGIEDPDLYRSAIEWIDAGSHYAGSDIFRRMDGSEERIEMDYAASIEPLTHTSQLEGWPPPVPLIDDL